jgi:hypothetical protein
MYNHGKMPAFMACIIRASGDARFRPNRLFAGGETSGIAIPGFRLLTEI